MPKTIPLTQGKHAIVDNDVYEWASQYRWHFAKVYKHYGYAARAEYSPKKKTIYLHQQIMQSSNGLHTDHINGDTLDCRRENLRLCTAKQNFCNSSAHRTGTTSKYKGVSRQKRLKNDTWLAQIAVNCQHHYLGCHKSEEAAARAYDRAAIEHHGEFARTNFPLSDYAEEPANA